MWGILWVIVEESNFAIRTELHFTWKLLSVRFVPVQAYEHQQLGKHDEVSGCHFGVCQQIGFIQRWWLPLPLRSVNSMWWNLWLGVDDYFQRDCHNKGQPTGTQKGHVVWVEPHWENAEYCSEKDQQPIQQNLFSSHLLHRTWLLQLQIRYLPKVTASIHIFWVLC